MFNMTLYFDANGEMGEHALGHVAYEGKIRVRPLFVGRLRVSSEDEKYSGYNQYMYKLESMLQGLIGVRNYIKEKGLVKQNYDGIIVNISSQHKPIHNMVFSRSAKEPYTSKVAEILEIVDAMGKEGIIVNIVNVTGDKNYAKKVTQEVIYQIRLEPKRVTLTNTPEELKRAVNSTQDNVGGVTNNVINIERFKIN